MREFSNAGGDAFLSMAKDLYREAREAGKYMPTGSTTKLARACLLAGDSEAAADVLIGTPREDQHEHGEHALHDLDSALDLLHSLARQEQQYEEYHAKNQRQGERDVDELSDAPF